MMLRWLTTRSTGDVLVLLITMTICFSVVASGAAITLIASFHPEADLTVWITRVTGIINTMIGLLAGFLAGRTDAAGRRNNDGPPSPSNQ